MFTESGQFFTSGGGYEIDQSIRFNDNDSAYLSRTSGATGDRKKWTFSAWIKRGNISSNQRLFHDTGNTNFIMFGTSSNDQFRVYLGADILTTALFRDPSAWYHIVVAVDTTQATASNRVKIYQNGVQVTSFTSAGYPGLNYDTIFNNSGTTYQISGQSVSEYFDGYISEFNWIDGLALAPTSFGETNDDGVWIPKAYTGAYGDNGFYITGATAGDLGEDFSGNNNDFTSSGLTSADQVVDTPTNNFPTFSSINLDGVTLSDGNLYCASAGYWSGAAATMSLPTTGKWYIETLVGNRYGSYMAQGFVPNDGSLITSAAQALNYGSQDSATTPNYGLGMSRGNLFGFYAATGTTTASVTEPDGSTLYSTNEIYICHALDLDNERYFVGTAFVGDGSVTWFGPSGSGADPETSSEGLDISAYLATYGDYGLTFFHAPNKTSGNPYATVDFGQSGFTFTKPTGFSALSTANLPTPAIADGSKYFQTTLYTGNGTAIGSGGLAVSQSENSTFQPDFVWIKGRSGATEHVLTDAVRGVTKELSSNDTGAEETVTEGLTTFGSAGFTVGSDGSYNTSSATYAGWQWLAGNGTASNEDGSITSTVSANAAAGFSIVSYTGNATGGATIGHGLSQAPEMVITKSRDNGTGRNWAVYHVVPGPTKYAELDGNGPFYAGSTRWNDTAPSSTVVTLGSQQTTNDSGAAMIAYCWHSVESFSRFGSFIGNGSANGSFIYTGMTPAFVIIKCSSVANSWTMYDTVRQTYNPNGRYLIAETNGAEVASTTVEIDILSNGFKARDNQNNINGSGRTYIYMAFAEHPFGGDGVAPATAR